MSLPEAVRDALRRNLGGLQERERDLAVQKEHLEGRLAQTNVDLEDTRQAIKSITDYLSDNGEPVEQRQGPRPLLIQLSSKERTS